MTEELTEPTESTDPTGSVSRRRLIAGAGVVAGAVWVAPSVLTVHAAAAASGSTIVELRKSAQGSTDTPLSTLCSNGANSTTGRGSVTFTRTENPATICATITVTSGPSVTGRQIYLLQSNSSGTCLAGTTTQIGTWAASPAGGPQTFCTPIVAGATRFVVALQVSGGGGTDSYSSFPASLP